MTWSVFEFSSALPWCPGEGEEREEVGDMRGKRLCPGENSAGGALLHGGWKAEGKDFRMGVSPAMLNIGLWARRSLRAFALVLGFEGLRRSTRCGG